MRDVTFSSQSPTHQKKTKEQRNQHRNTYQTVLILAGHAVSCRIPSLRGRSRLQKCVFRTFKVKNAAYHCNLDLQLQSLSTTCDALKSCHYFKIFFLLSHKGFSHLDVMLVECYDPKADQWNILQTPILEGRSGPGCAVLDDSIFLVGGYSWSMVHSDTSDQIILDVRIRLAKL